MRLAEKLANLTKNRNKAELSRTAGLPATALSDYVSKGYIPKADTALKLARALEVPVEWLIDDEADFPVPASFGKQLKDHTDDDVIQEVAHRVFVGLQQVQNRIDRLLAMDLPGLTRRAYELPLDTEDAAIEEVVKLIAQIETDIVNIEMLADTRPIVRAMIEGATSAKGDKSPIDMDKIDNLAAESMQPNNVYYRALIDLSHLQATYMLPTMRDAAEAQRLAFLRQLDMMPDAKPAAKLKAASKKR